MYFCYLDESGTPETRAQTSHFVLLGLVIPASVWRDKDAEIDRIKGKYGLTGKEIHTGWMMRSYPEQEAVADFDKLDATQRRTAALAGRKSRLAAARTPEKAKQLKRFYAKSEDYVHLTQFQRARLLRDLADQVGKWTDARLFAEAVDKRAVAPGYDVFAKSFEQVVTRFHTFLRMRQVQTRNRRIARDPAANLGLLIQDNNETVAKKLTELMRKFHWNGTLWSDIRRIIETPLFVDSSLTSMVQIADLCSYATRRFFENGETDLFDRIFGRFDTKDGRAVGIRHYTSGTRCNCAVCIAHGR